MNDSMEKIEEALRGDARIACFAVTLLMGMGVGALLAFLVISVVFPL